MLKGMFTRILYANWNRQFNVIYTETSCHSNLYVQQIKKLMKQFIVDDIF